MRQLASPITVRPSPIPLLKWSAASHPERAVTRGELVQIRRGVYASAPLWKALAPWDRYLARVHAAAMIYPDAVFCLESAAVLLGMPVFGDPVIVHMLMGSTATARQISGVRVHKSRPERTIHEISGLGVTSPADTAVDLARHRHNAVGLAAADAAVRSDPTLTRDALLALNESRSSARGRRIARWPLSRCTALAETALESISRAAIEWLGFPAPELQVVFRSGTGEADRSDCFWREASLAGEADGDIKYDGRFGDPRTILWKQRQRDTRLRRAHVREIAHWGWSDATGHEPLRDILTGAGLRPIGPEDSQQLASMKRLLAPRAPHPTARQADHP